MFSKINLKFISKLDLPKKSILGFKVLSSLQSSISCYILLFIGKSLNLLFGNSIINLIAGSAFNIILNLSLVILIINLIYKRKQLKKLHFILLNFILFIYLPVIFFEILKYSKILIFFFFKYNHQIKPYLIQS